MKNYRPRIWNKILKDKLGAKGAVIIEGPKYNVNIRKYD